MDDLYKSNSKGEFASLVFLARQSSAHTVYDEQFRQSAGYESIKNKFGVGPSPARLAALKEIGSDASLERSYHRRSILASKPGTPVLTLQLIQYPETTFRCDNLRLDPGRDIQIRVVSKDGNPIKKFTVYHKDRWGTKLFPNGTATLHRMGMDEIRIIHIKNEEDTMAIETNVFW